MVEVFGAHDLIVATSILVCARTLSYSVATPGNLGDLLHPGSGSVRKFSLRFGFENYNSSSTLDLRHLQSGH